MANRFWVGGSGDLDGVTTTHIAATSGGAGGASYPGSGDTLTFDGSSGGGTVTASVDHTWQSLTCGAFTGTLDWSTNNRNVTLTNTANAFNNTSSGTRTVRLGNGTWDFTGTSGTLFTQNGATNLTFNANGSTILFSGTGTANRLFAGGGFTYNNFTIATNSGNTTTTITGANTFNVMTVTGPNQLWLMNGTTQTVTTLAITGSSGNAVNLTAVANSTTTAPTAQATISVAAGTQTLTWCGIHRIAATGGATFAATSSFDLGGNSGFTSITAPSGGGGGGLAANPLGGFIG